jgi:hypothetical protein
MDKVKKFLEGYVEWLAIALGLGFLGWTVYGYVIDKPVTSTVGSETVELSAIPQKIWDGPGQDLDAKIKQVGAVPDIAPKVNYPDEIVKNLTVVPPVIVVEKSPYIPLQPSFDVNVAPTPEGPGNIAKVTALPDLPAAINLAISHGHSNIQPPNANNTQAVAQIDKNWITFAGSIPVAALADNLAKSKIPPALSNVCIYRVIATREEQDAAGNWINPTEIQPLDINPLEPLPAQNCNPTDRQDYKTWAETPANAILIAEPPFYTVVHGSVWYEPGMPDPNDTGNQLVTEPFDPTNPLAFKGDPTMLFPDEKKAYDEAKARQAQADARKNHTSQSNLPGQQNLQQPPSPNSPGTTSGHGGTRGGRSNGIMEPAPTNPANPLMQPPPGEAGAPGGFRGPYQGRGESPAPMTPQPSTAAATLPQGSFNPAARVAAAAGASPDIKIWVHDDTVQPGKTYRYKLRYILSNPVAGTSNTCQNPKDAEVAWIASADSDWSTPINVESDTSFYALDNKHGIHFEIFKWMKGAWQMQDFQANPGDRVGATDPVTKTDFDTGWTLVDVREDPEGNNDNKVLVLVSDNGTVKEKEIRLDRQNQNYRKLYQEVMKDQKTASAGGPGTPPPGLPPTR